MSSTLDYNTGTWDFLNLPSGDFSLNGLDHSAFAAPIGASSSSSAAVRGPTTLDPTRFPAPQAEADTPPASEESSPSPPSLAMMDQQDDDFALPSGGRSRRKSTADDASKRKVDDISDSDDSTYGGQPHKAQHRSDNSSGRKSAGGAGGTKGSSKKGGQEGDRALKRKEQNRAAQRAFRERKERHVKELEDQVAELENEAKTKDRENENLRDLLGRLQNENLLLKQSAFTFSFPPDGKGTSPASAAAGGSANARQASSPSMSSPSSSSNASSPENSANNTNNVVNPQSSLFARSSSNATSSSASSPGSEANSSRFQTSPSAFGLGHTGLTPGPPDFSNMIDFSGIANLDPLMDDFAKKNGGDLLGQSGITTIASNPLYTSFMNDPVLDPMAWNSIPADYITTENGLQTNLDGIPAFVNGLNTNSAGMVSLDDLLGASPSSSSSNGGYPALDLATNSGSAVGSSVTGTFSAASPSNSGVESGATGDCGSDGCPTSIEAVKKLQGKLGSHSTFGPRPPLGSPITSSGSSGSGAAGDVASTKGTKGEANAHARMAALCADLPRTVKKPNQIEIGRAWEKIRQSKGFEECDIDELCNELSAKARCDGSRPVLEESSFNDIVNGLPVMYRQ